MLGSSSSQFDPKPTSRTLRRRRCETILFAVGPHIGRSQGKTVTAYMKFICRSTLGLACLSLTIGSVSAQLQDRAFQFGLIGDVPYTTVQQQEYQRVLAALNTTDLAFVVHVGDFQNDPRGYYPNPAVGLLPCLDDNYKAIYESFQSVRHPFILTPGDNDWTDCHLVREPKIDPLERLAKVRAMFFPEGHSLGQRTLPVESQAKDSQYAKFRENLRWSIGGVTFATLHIVGSNDNFGRTPEMDAEQRERKAANIAWMRAAFAKGKSDGSRGLVLMTQANPGFENYWPPAAKGRYFGPFVGRSSPPPVPPNAFDDYISALAEEVETYDKPVAYLHGDTHLHRIDKPLYSKKTNRMFENFTRVETFGNPDTHWVLVTVDPSDPQLFTFKGEIVPGNVVNHRTK